MGKPHIRICIGSSCFARGNEQNVDVVEKFLAARNLKDEVDLELEGCLCLGHCTEGPIIVINDKLYNNVSGGVMLDLLEHTFPKQD